ncbi:hypothetical protein [Dongia sp.]|uniref:hypothetical protein n=1 Tax=Dongia sp. TaxID=1977262 RepID=UPI0035B2D065
MMLVNRNVISIQDRPAPVSYVTADGEICECKFDYLVDYADGTRTAFVVQYEGTMERFHIREKIEAARHQLGRKFANKVVVHSEQTITADMAKNAEILWACGGIPVHQIYAPLRELASTLNGAVKIGVLMTMFADVDGIFRHVVSLIDNGYLALANGGRISPENYVVRTAKRKVA